MVALVALGRVGERIFSGVDGVDSLKQLCNFICVNLVNLNGIHHQSMMTTKWASSFFSSSLEEDAVKMMREKGRGDYAELRKKKGKRDKDWNGLKGDEGD